MKMVFWAYNIRNGWNDGLESALHGMSQANVDLGVFQETKVNKGIYTRELSGYQVVASEASSAHSGSVTVFFCAAEHFSVDGLSLHGINVVSFQMALGGQRWYIMGCYLAPDNALSIEDVVVAIIQQNCDSVLLVDGYSNSDLAAPEGHARD